MIGPDHPAYPIITDFGDFVARRMLSSSLTTGISYQSSRCEPKCHRRFVGSCVNAAKLPNRPGEFGASRHDMLTASGHEGCAT